MKTFTIVPMVGIRGGIQFGMTRQEVHRLMAPATAEHFQRYQTLVDGFYGASLQVNYDVNERVEFIEFGRSDASVLFDGLDLLKFEASLVIERLGTNHEMDESELGSCYTIHSIEFGLWRPDPEDSTFESVGFGRKGYYSKEK